MVEDPSRSYNIFFDTRIRWDISIQVYQFSIALFLQAKITFSPQAYALTKLNFLTIGRTFPDIKMIKMLFGKSATIYKGLDHNIFWDFSFKKGTFQHVLLIKCVMQFITGVGNKHTRKEMEMKISLKAKKIRQKSEK